VYFSKLIAGLPQNILVQAAAKFTNFPEQLLQNSVILIVLVAVSTVILPGPLKDLMSALTLASLAPMTTKVSMQLAKPEMASNKKKTTRPFLMIGNLVIINLISNSENVIATLN
jgi:hypothetical protein